MRVLLLNQTFYPDTVATAQYLTDAAEALYAEGHQVTVLTSARAYDDPERIFPSRETWRGIEIVRITPLAFGKTSRWRRAVDFGSYIVRCAAELALLGRYDVVVALTSPPLISVLGAIFAAARNARFVFWVMDLNPDEAIAAGWLKPHSMVARALERLLRFSLAKADVVVALDRFMADILVSKGISSDRIAVVPPWSHASVRFDAPGRDAFRRDHGWTDRFVVMYAGNHSPCNPLHTVVEAAERLRADPSVVFCFLGGGSAFRELQNEVRLPNVACLPYVTREELGAALSAADLHVVTLGDPFRGLIHPCKVYNVLKVGAPVLYVGPEPSHVTDIASATGMTTWRVAHGDIAATVAAIEAAKSRNPEQRAANEPIACEAFGADRLVPAFVDLVIGHTVAAIPTLEQA